MTKLTITNNLFGRLTEVLAEELSQDFSQAKSITVVYEGGTLTVEPIEDQR